MSARAISLHIGLDDVDGAAYPDWRARLQAAQRDAAAMAVLAERAGFTTSLLVGDQATRDGVLAGLRRVARNAAPGDLVLVTYSGHGAQFGEGAKRPAGAEDLRADEEDGHDESWCLWDGFLLDDVIHDRLAEFRPGVRVFLVVDACHSGTCGRDGREARGADNAAPLPPGARAIPADRARAAFAAQCAQGLDAAVVPERPIAASVLVLAACRDEQVAVETEAQGRFTAAVLAAWDGGTFTGDHDAFCADVSRRSPSSQTPVLSRLGPDDPSFATERPFTP